MVGICECGCGEKTNIARCTDPVKGWVFGQPLRYILGHSRRFKGTPWWVNEKSQCWEWTLYKNWNGYGIQKVAGKMKRAHRVVYEKYVGPIPAGMDLDHLCKNRGCVNPKHLEPVTGTENARRRKDSKLNMTKVTEIRRLLKLGVKGSVVAKQFGISQDTVSNIKLNKQWQGEKK